MAILGCVLLALQALQNSSPIITDRPDFTESSVVVPPGSVQVEAGLTYSSARPTVAFGAPELLVRYSLSPLVEARFGLPNHETVRGGGQTTSGWTDSSIGVKIQLGPTPDGTDMALILATFLPTGSDGFGSRVWEPEFKFCASRELSPGVSLSAMLAGSAPDNGNHRLGSWQTTLSLGRSLTDNSGIFLEYAGNFMVRNQPQHIFHAGFVYQPCATSQWDIHFGFDIADARRNAFVGLGYSVRF